MIDDNINIFNWSRESDNVFYADSSVFVLSQNMIEYLILTAKENNSSQSRVCLHRDYQDVFHEMIIVLLNGHYVPPHKHDGKAESFHVIEGKLAVVIFSNIGKVDEVIFLEKGKGFYRLSDDFYHMVVPLSDKVVFHEATNGPFVRGDMVISPWAPDKNENSETILEYQREIKRIIQIRMGELIR
ncbi:MAG: cupin fold metalloprotein, WbuC family [Candidatus Marinimicrobia bacterium]|jgi:cupin fold WbuC family metalloprotein|nr:cupin fold metalloprotein, WbuC family [Candidatus Neomarinimicrobiota bacterium]MBT5270213.1 cupin fold metalloprotein, WbuC family [Candidatus Neomarinimicrobiota bacterium]MBT6011089.1 cupin fold metalloprotein, WbuC family [Candidatus Neomarinimicrobiota bacterium]